MTERWKQIGRSALKWVVAIGVLLAAVLAVTTYRRAQRARDSRLREADQLSRLRSAKAMRLAQFKQFQANKHLENAEYARELASERIKALRENRHETMAALVERWNGGPVDGLRDDAGE